MNRGFAFYFAKGMRTAAKSILKGGKLLQYYIYFFASLIGRLIPFVGMIFFVSDVRRAKIAKDEGELTILRPFGGVENGASFGAAVLSSLLLLLLLLGGLSIAAGIGYGLYIGGYAFGKAVDVNQPATLGVVFAIPAIAAALVYIVVMLLLFAPVPYIIDTNEKNRRVRCVDGERRDHAPRRQTDLLFERRRSAADQIGLLRLGLRDMVGLDVFGWV